MAIWFRKSIKVGLFRFNVSKSGVGVSAGVKGLRAGINSKGKRYISGGVDGIRFLEQFNKPDKTKEEQSIGCIVWFIVAIAVVLSFLFVQWLTK